MYSWIIKKQKNWKQLDQDYNVKLINFDNYGSQTFWSQPLLLHGLPCWRLIPLSTICTVCLVKSPHHKKFKYPWKAHYHHHLIRETWLKLWKGSRANTKHRETLKCSGRVIEFQNVTLIHNWLHEPWYMKGRKRCHSCERSRQSNATLLFQMLPCIPLAWSVAQLPRGCASKTAWRSAGAGHDETRHAGIWMTTSKG